MKVFMAVLAQALKFVMPKHFKAVDPVPDVMSNKFIFSTAQLARPAGIAFDLQRDELPVACAQKMIVRHFPNRSRNIGFVYTLCVSNHLI